MHCNKQAYTFWTVYLLLKFPTILHILTYNSCVILFNNTITYVVGDKVAIQSFKLKTLLPENTREFYRYQGSLTTPPCFETVQWTVFKDTITMSESQVGIGNAFYSMTI